VFSLHKEEKTYSDSIKNFFMKFGFNVSVFVKENRRRVIINSSELAKHFSKLCGEGADNKHIHNSLLFSEINLSIVDGIYNGDGTDIKRQKSITTISKTLAKQICLILLLRGYNVRAYISNGCVDKVGTKHKTRYSIYYSANKKNQVNRRDGFIKVKEITRNKVSNTNVYDLTVANDSSYLVGPFAVHNCGVPCSKCFVKIINAGIEELIVTSFKTYDLSTQYLWDQSDVKVRLFDFIKK
jgi:intein/homing endonuclease